MKNDMNENFKITSVCDEEIYADIRANIAGHEFVEADVIFGEGTVNVPDIMDEIYCRIRGDEKVISNAAISEMDKQLRYANEDYFIEFDAPLTSSKQSLKKPIIFAKKFIRKFIRWYIRPIVSGYNEHNSSVLKALNHMPAIMSEMDNKISVLQQEVERLKAANAELTRQINNSGK